MKYYLYMLEMYPDIRFKLIPLHEADCEGEPLDRVSFSSTSKFCRMVSRSPEMKEMFYSKVADILEADLDAMQRMSNLALNRFTSFNNFWQSEISKNK